MSIPVFKGLSFGRQPEDKEIVINEIDPETFANVLEWIYLSKLKRTSVAEACKYITAGRKYCMDHLIQECCAYVENYISPATAPEVYEIGISTEDAQLQDISLQVLKSRTQEVIDDPNFVTIKRETLSAILDLETLNVRSEAELYKAVVKWAKQECVRRSLEPNEINERHVVGDDIVGKIRFLTFTKEEFADVVGNIDFLTGEEKLNLWVSIACPNESVASDTFSRDRKRRVNNQENVDVPSNKVICRRDPSPTFTGAAFVGGSFSRSSSFPHEQVRSGVEEIHDTCSCSKASTSTLGGNQSVNLPFEEYQRRADFTRRSYSSNPTSTSGGVATSDNLPKQSGESLYREARKRRCAIFLQDNSSIQSSTGTGNAGLGFGQTLKSSMTQYGSYWSKETPTVSFGNSRGVPKLAPSVSYSNNSSSLSLWFGFGKAPSATTPNNTSSQSLGFSFGGAPSATTPNNTSSQSLGFSFGGAPSATTPNNTSSQFLGFSFGGSPRATTPNNTSSQSLGLGFGEAPRATTPNNTSSQSLGFSFGGAPRATIPNNTSSQSLGFRFGGAPRATTTNNTSSQSLGFSFESAPRATTPNNTSNQSLGLGFGEAPRTTTPNNTSSQSLGYSFEAAPRTTTPNNTSSQSLGFSFGGAPRATTPNNTSSQSLGFSFGGAPRSTTPNNTSSQSLGLGFGEAARATTPNNTSSQSLGFGFEAAPRASTPNNTSSQSVGFSFGKAPRATTPTRNENNSFTFPFGSCASMSGFPGRTTGSALEKTPSRMTTSLPTFGSTGTPDNTFNQRSLFAPRRITGNQSTNNSSNQNETDRFGQFTIEDIPRGSHYQTSHLTFLPKKFLQLYGMMIFMDASVFKQRSLYDPQETELTVSLRSHKDLDNDETMYVLKPWKIQTRIQPSAEVLLPSPVLLSPDTKYVISVSGCSLRSESILETSQAPSTDTAISSRPSDMTYNLGFDQFILCGVFDTCIAGFIYKDLGLG